MLKQALSEIRLYPGRFVATIIAIAISVAFMAAISVFVSTAENGLGRSNAMHVSQADLVVGMKELDDYGSARMPDEDLASALSAVPGVQLVSSISPGAAEIRADDRTLLATVYTDLPAQFRWAELAEGRWPEAPDEITLAAKGADALQIGVGDTVEAWGQMLDVVGLTADATTLWGTVGYLSSDGQQARVGDTDFVLALTADADAETVRSAVLAVLQVKFPDGEVTYPDTAIARSLVNTTQGFDVLKYLLWAFAGVAVLVGMITIANTFTILVAQRRRQVALLRVVGASGGQVMGRLIVESFLLGIVGSLIGVALAFLVATAGAAITGVLFWGLRVEWGEVGVALLVGTAATMISATAPAMSAARVKPLEALQAVPTPVQAKRAGVVRAILCVVFIVAAAGMILVALRAENDWALAWAVGGSGLLTVAVLAGAPLYIAPLLRLAGKMVGRLGPTPRLAMENAARNPRRAAAAATALMLAIGMIVTLQVGLASTRSTAMNKINQEFPLDVAASYYDGVPSGLADRIAQIDGVQSVALVRAKEADIDGLTWWALDDTARADLGVSGNPIPDGVARFGGESAPAGEVVIGERILKVERDHLYPYETFAVNAATFDQLPGAAMDFAVWVKLTDRTSPTALGAVIRAVEEQPGADLSSSGAQYASILEQIIGVVLVAMTALLGVAVLIAIVGVGNTLGLSVLERQRESALLRALGMQRGQLRSMLLIEAFALVGIGAVVGFAAGVFFGWLGLTTVVGIAKSTGGVIIDTRFALDPWWTVALVAVCVISAVLASLLPGRKAANATPTEALAVD